jgi:hypothetical protein
MRPSNRATRLQLPDRIRSANAKFKETKILVSASNLPGISFIRKRSGGFVDQRPSGPNKRNKNLPTH